MSESNAARGEVDTLRAEGASSTAPVDLTAWDRKRLELLAKLRHGASRPGGREALATDPAASFEPFPLTDIQQAYWLGRGSGFELGSVATHVYREFECTGLDVDRLEAAWRVLIARHPMLRTVIEDTGEQRVLPRTDFSVERFDLRGQPMESVAERCEALRDTMSHEVLPTDRAPMLRCAAVIGDGGTRLHLSADLLVLDAWSFQILSSELATLYRTPGTALAPIELNFRDVVLHERKRIDSASYRRAKEYWDARVDTLPPRPELPLAVSPSTIAQPHFGRRTGEVSTRQWQTLRARAKAIGVTPSVLLLTAFADVLEQWSRHPHFTLTLTLFNRRPVHPDIECVVGDFTSVTLLEVDGRVSMPLRERAKTLQRQLWRDLDHRDVSGVEVIRELVRRKGGDGATFPVVFTSMMHGERGAPFEWIGEETFGISQTPQVWLDHQVFEHEGGLKFSWDSVEALFPEGLLDAMFAAYEARLRQLAGDETLLSLPAPNLRPARQVERHALNDCTGVDPSPDLLQAPFFAAAKRFPERAAVTASGCTLTYAELERQALALSSALCEAQSACEAGPIAIVMEKGCEQVVAAIAVLAAGKAFVPIDPSLPPQRVMQLIRDAGVKIMVSQPWLALAGVSGPLKLTIDANAPAKAPVALTHPIDSAPHDLAYVIYTSGSTGEPKGVMISHEGASTTVDVINRTQGMGPDDVVLGVSSLGFDLAIWDIFGTLGAGGHLVLPEPDAVTNPARWLALMSQHGVSVWNSAPALFDMLVQWAEATDELFPPTLRLAMLSGDWIPVSLPTAARARSSRGQALEVLSLGGATEASIWSIAFPITEVPPDWTSIPYGKALDAQSMFVLDEHFRERPDWVPGELYIGGAGVALGYLGDEEKTNARFLRHPTTGDRLYRTGDMGRFLPSGDIEFLGREDTQVKIRGHRIELGEIDHVAASYDGVARLTTLVLGARHQQSLAMFVVPTSPDSVDIEALRAYLASKLPSYMVPGRIALVDDFPVNRNGKIDRQALLALASEAGSRRPSGRIDAPDAIGLICAVCAELLGTTVSADEDFFELGGDSLLGIRLLSRLREHGAELTPADLFECRTPRSLATRVGGAMPPDGGVTSDGSQRTFVETRTVCVIQSGARRAPIYCIHPTSGDIDCYLRLARYLPRDVPVIGLRNAGNVPAENGMAFEALAARYVDEIERYCEWGPFNLLGWSLGGVLTWAVASELNRRGRDLGFVGVVDVGPSGHAASLGCLDDSSLSALIAGEGGRTPTSQTLAVARGNLEALLRYTPDASKAPVTVFRATLGTTGEQPPHIGWQGLSPAVTVIDVIGDHFSIMTDPTIETIALAVTDALSEDGAADVVGGRGKVPGARSAGPASPARSSPERSSPVRSLAARSDTLAPIHVDSNAWVEAGAEAQYRLPPGLNVGEYAEGIEAMNDLALAYLTRATDALGLFDENSADGLSRAVLEQASASHRKLIDGWLTTLARAGWCARTSQGTAPGESWRKVDPGGHRDVASALARANASPGLPSAVVAHVARAGEGLVDMISGARHPLEVLFRDGSVDLQEFVFQDLPASRFANEIARDVVSSFAKEICVPEGVHVLEVGAGTGGTTMWLLPELAGKCQRYAFTDNSRFFTDYGKQKFSEYDFVDYDVLDLDHLAPSQGFAYGTFHVALGANVIHATPDVVRTLEELRRLVVPGGMVLLLELSAHHAWQEVAIGPMDGWNGYTDHRRSNHHPLLTPREWMQALSAAGLEMVHAFPEPDDATNDVGQHIIVGRRPAKDPSG